MTINGIVGQASNVRAGNNPPFNTEDFLGYTPIWKDDSGKK